MNGLHLLYTGYYCDNSYRDSFGALATCIVWDSMFDRSGAMRAFIFYTAQWVDIYGIEKVKVRLPRRTIGV
jgi:hypothetical protein